MTLFGPRDGHRTSQNCSSVQATSNVGAPLRPWVRLRPVSCSQGHPWVAAALEGRIKPMIKWKIYGIAGVTKLAQGICCVSSRYPSANERKGTGESRGGGLSRVVWFISVTPLLVLYRHPPRGVGRVGWGDWLSFLPYSFIRHPHAPGNSNSNAPVADKNGAQEATADSPGLQVPLFLVRPDHVGTKNWVCAPPLSLWLCTLRSLFFSCRCSLTGRLLSPLGHTSWSFLRAVLRRSCRLVARKLCAGLCPP